MDKHNKELIIIYNLYRHHKRNAHLQNNVPQDNVPRAQNTQNNSSSPLNDYGPNPFVTDVNKAATHNETFRTVFWTGVRLQATLMSIQPGGEIGAETHPSTDQFLYVADGRGVTQIGNDEPNSASAPNEKPIYTGDAVFVPAGVRHNVINTGNRPLKLFSIYAPPEHPYGNVER